LLVLEDEGDVVTEIEMLQKTHAMPLVFRVAVGDGHQDGTLFFRGL
jgi:hypothetical protein